MNPMNPEYHIAGTSTVFSPALVFYKDLIRRNLSRMIELAGSPTRLRPHVKTHKTREIVQLELDAGITKHKCATIAEAEMLAGCGVPDVLLAYNLVGPNCGRMARLVQAFPQTRFAVLADDARALRALSQAMTAVEKEIDILLDVNPGQHRTGIIPGPEAVALYRLITELPGLRPGGLHWYDGHNHQESLTEREAAVCQQLAPLRALHKTLVEGERLPVPRVVLGGTPTFPIHSRIDLPGVECAPGTCVLHDHGYGTRFQDLNGFTPAALLLTRVISRPTPTRVTLDLGTKAVASDPPAGKRCVLLDMPDYEPVMHSEEHFVIETPTAARFQPGDEVLAVPTHICPTCALHRSAYVVEDGRVTGEWPIVARDRVLRF